MLCIRCKYQSIVTCRGDYKRGLDWWMDLLTTHTHDSELQALTTLIHKSPQHPLNLIQPAVFSPAIPQQRLLTMEILQFHALKQFLHNLPCRIQLSTNWVAPFIFKITPRYGLCRKHSSSIVVEVCLPRRCVATVAARWQKTSFFYCCLRICCRCYLSTAVVYRVNA
jgi:hypothetical protein